MLSTFAGLALCAAAGGVSAQDRAAAGADVQVRRISNIMKTKVIIQDDKPAGEIVDVVYNDGGCIDYFVAAYDNRQYVVPFDAIQYRSADRVVFVDIAPAQFERVHFFTANQWPDFYAPGFRDQVFASFNIRAGGRNRTTFRQGTDVDVDVRNRDRDRDPADRNRDRDGAPDRNRDRDQAPDRNRPDATDRDRDRPGATDRDRDRPASPADRPERAPATPDRGDRPGAEPRDNTPAPPRPGAGNNPGREGASPPRSGSDNNPGRDSNAPKPGVNPGSGSTPPARPQPKADEKKPLTPPPVVPK
jgi:hypothetical protein